MRNPANLTLNDIGELGAIERICRFLPRSGGKIVCSTGDDCAVVRTEPDAEYDLVLTSDAVIEGTHFTGKASPTAIGHKAMARVLSDIAAMGGKPEWALIDLVAPGNMRLQTLDKIYESATRTARRHGLAIIGGDTASGNHLQLHVFAVGTVPRRQAVLRSGAKPGNLIFITGTLGGSSMGKHLNFKPRVREGLFLRKWATSMIDISDGPASDLRHLITMSKTGALIETSKIPVSREACSMSDGIPALDHALYDGEDFELLFTVRKNMAEEFLGAWRRKFSLRCTEIGRITNEKGVIRIIENDRTSRHLKKRGYQHFER